MFKEPVAFILTFAEDVYRAGFAKNGQGVEILILNLETSSITKS